MGFKKEWEYPIGESPDSWQKEIYSTYNDIDRIQRIVRSESNGP